MPPSTVEETPRPKNRFGVFEFDPQTRELTKHGVRLKLQEQPIQILAALLEQAGRIVPREELQRRLWPDGTFVDYEQSLNKAVNKLREALGDSASKPIYIETLAQRGYRFAAPVEVERPKVVERPEEDMAAEGQPVRARSRLRWGASALGLVAACVLVTGLWPVPPPKARVTQLTNGGHRGAESLAVHDGRLLYAAQPQPTQSIGNQCCWSVSTGRRVEMGENALSRPGAVCFPEPTGSQARRHSDTRRWREAGRSSLACRLRWEPAAKDW
jgi:DNA-binding winged helix-turn-helix (wHTH) protein